MPITMNASFVSSPAAGFWEDESFLPCQNELGERNSFQRCKNGEPRRREALIFLATFALGLFLGLVMRGVPGWDHLVTHNLAISVAPTKSSKSVVFLEEATYSAPPSNVSNAAWESLIPVGRGFVELEDGDPGRKKRYCVSAFHQLHCLDMLRRGYYSAAGSSSNGAVERHSHADQPVHMQHCFDYIRQALMCAADATLEERDETISGVKGWGTTHQCRDFEALQRWTSDHRYSDEGGIAN
ncbi:hypothetical protein F5Y18DRAFT_327458 [Xylariaceae sp. FL1019]|nr:hypothetical protein F5Y18DRAFT_327458 [Xylariaceae sp. FL1019]